mgnify:CR=1 FL=1
MKKYTCIIIDDEELSRELLENFIERISHLELSGKFTNPLTALPILNEKTIDIIFLDIQMPEMTGIELLKTLSNPPVVILTTAYDKYAIEGFELSVTDYLLKPFSFTRFLQAVNKATELIDLRFKGDKMAFTDSSRQASGEFILVNADHKLHRIYLKSIIYIQSMREYIVYYSDQGRIMALGSLKGLEEKLPNSDFIRIHKSYIVAKKRVVSMEGTQVNIGGITLPIGGSYKSDVVAQLFT